MTPSCSIVIPTHNRPGLLARAVRSARAACPADGEVVVVDDRSGTALAALAEQAGDPRLTVHENDRAPGAAGARNCGAGLARAEVILFLDDDDEMLPDYPARVLAAAAAEPRASFGFSNGIYRRGGREGSPVIEEDIKRRTRRGLIPHDAPLHRLIAPLSAGFWIRRSIFDAVGGLDEAQTVDEDTELCVRLAASGHSAWFEAEPGVIVYRAYEKAPTDTPQLTIGTDLQAYSASAIRTYLVNRDKLADRPLARWELLERALRRCAKARAWDLGQDLLKQVEPGPMRLVARVFWRLKWLRHS